MNNLSTDALDLFRIGILVQAGLVILATLCIWVYYSSKAMRRTPQQPMLWHIITISASYNLAVVFIAMATIERMGMPFTWRLPVAALVFILGDAGLCFMLSHLYSHRIYAQQKRAELARENNP